MPGLHFMFRGGAEKPQQLLKQPNFESALHAPDYTSEILFSSARTLLCASGYPEYPIRKIDRENISVFFEGHIYADDFQARLEGLVELIRQKPEHNPAVRDRLGDWILRQDGDFLLVIQDKSSGQWYLINDALGRLPVYAFAADGVQYFTREFRLVSGVYPDTKPDRIACAQMLLFGYSLGERTLLENVARLPGATLVCADSKTGRLSRFGLRSFSFDPVQSAPETSAAELVEDFTSACRARAKVGETAIMGLSGGHDSRSVAAALSNLSVPVKAYTVTDWQSGETADTKYGRETAEKLQLDWTLWSTPVLAASDAAQILRLKGGMVFTETSHGLRLFAYLAEKYGRDLVYFSGDGGDKIMPDLWPNRKLRSVDQAARYLVDRLGIWSIKDACRLCRIQVHDFLSDLARLLTSYPESSPGGKTVHFNIFEVEGKWLFEGEDRNRCFFWSCSPFYSLPFFAKAMRIPCEDKRYHRLYREFLSALRPDMITINDANRGLPMSSRKYAARLRVIRAMERFPGLIRAVKDVALPHYHRARPNPKIAAVITKQLQSAQSLGQYLDIDSIRQVMRPDSRVTVSTQHNLLTLTSAIEQHTEGKLSLAEFGQDGFD